MDLRQLEYLCEIAKAGSFSSAAKSLYVSQQALSKAIAALECELGIELFVRGNKGVRPTAQGVAVMTKAREVLDEVDSLKQATQAFRGVLEGSLSVGFLYDCLGDDDATIPVKTVVFFGQGHKELDVKLVELENDPVKKGVYAGSLDLGIVVGDVDESDKFESVFLKELWFDSVAVSRLNPLSFAESLSWYDLRHERIAVPAGNDYALKTMTSVCSHQGSSPAFCSWSSKFETNREFMYANQGVLLVSACHAGRIDRTKASLVPLDEGSAYGVPLRLIWGKTRCLPRAGKAFRDYLISRQNVSEPYRASCLDSNTFC